MTTLHQSAVNIVIPKLSKPGSGHLRQDNFGRLCDGSVTGSKALPDQQTQLLLGGSA